MTGGSSGFRVLITNFRLARRAGTQLYVLDLARALQQRGHRPVVYSPLGGPFSDQIRAATIPVVHDLAEVGAPPDVIHGHQHLPTLTALLAFPGVPAVMFCHGWDGWQESPVHFPRVLRYVAVDDTCGDRLVLENGIPDDRVHVVLNFVDLERFRPRPPLPASPARALIFGNAAVKSAPYVGAIREACGAAGVPVDVIGAGWGAASDRPEERLGVYDVVFAKAKAALEAMAVGAAVILCDAQGCGGLVTTANFDRLRRLNFGRRALGERATAELIAAELARYDPADASAVARHVRESASREAVVDELVALYGAVIAEQRGRPANIEDEQRIAARCLQAIATRFANGELMLGGFSNLLKLPLVGRALRLLAAMQSPDRRLPRAIRMLGGE